MLAALITFLTDHREEFAVVANLVTIFGVPSGIFVFLLAKRKERKAREYETYDALDDKYIALQHLCLEYPHLDILDVPHENRQPLTETEKRQELAAFSILFSIFERAFLMYENHSDSIRKSQWDGWKDYIVHHLRRKSTREAWKILSVSGGQFDTGFTKRVNHLLPQIENDRNGSTAITATAPE